MIPKLLLSYQAIAKGYQTMRKYHIAAIVALLSALVLSSCANTIRGIGRDVNETADAIGDTMR